MPPGREQSRTGRARGAARTQRHTAHRPGRRPSAKVTPVVTAVPNAAAPPAGARRALSPLHRTAFAQLQLAVLEPPPGPLHQVHEAAQVRPPDGLVLARLGQPLPRVVADGLQQVIARVTAAVVNLQQRFAGQPGEQLEHPGGIAPSEYSCAPPRADWRISPRAARRASWAWPARRSQRRRRRGPAGGSSPASAAGKPPASPGAGSPCTRERPRHSPAPPAAR